MLKDNLVKPFKSFFNKNFIMQDKVCWYLSLLLKRVDVLDLELQDVIFDEKVVTSDKFLFLRLYVDRATGFILKQTVLDLHKFNAEKIGPRLNIYDHWQRYAFNGYYAIVVACIHCVFHRIIHFRVYLNDRWIKYFETKGFETWSKGEPSMLLTCEWRSFLG